MSKFPKVSIIMATYNRAHFIVETLQTIQAQTFKGWECLIIDDGGTDNTNEVIAPILEQDNRFQFLKRPDKYLKGLPGCRNYGLDVAKGDYIIFFDDDDIVHPDNLKTCIEIFDEKDVDFCHYQKLAYSGSWPKIGTDPITIQQYLSKDDIENIVTQKIGLASCTVMWKRGCFENCRFNENLLYAEEWECYSRLVTENFKGVIIDNILYYNRKHLNSNTGEFFRNNPVRIASKKEAIRLITYDLARKKILSENVLKYLCGLAIGFRDVQLLNDILSKAEIKSYNKLFLQLKYWLFPLWKVYKRIGKKLK